MRIAVCCTFQVIDATWEPEEVSLPPHRRSVPLTLEQVEAQMPPHHWVRRRRRRYSHWFGDYDSSDSDDTHRMSIIMMRQRRSWMSMAVPRGWCPPMVLH